MSSPFPPKKPAPAVPPATTGDPQADAALDDQAQLDADNAAAGNPTPGSPQASLTTTDQATLNDDWTKVAAWDVTDASGQPVTTLDGLAAVLGTDRTTAASMLLSSPMAAAAPPELTAEANEEVSPTGGSLYGEFSDEIPTDTAPADDAGDEESGAPDPAADPEAGDPEDQADGGADEDTEDESDDDMPAFLKGKKGKSLAAGAFVQLPDGRRGRVELIATNGGRIPGVTGELVGTKADPAARVRIYSKAGNRWLPTGQRTAVKTAELAAQAAPRPVTAGNVSAQLVLKVAQHAGPAGSGRPTAEAIREAYSRGKASWPGQTKTLLSADQWAMGRVDAFVAKAEGYETPAAYVGDDDLLP